MNFNKFINSDYLKDNPLCGINTYKDRLNLATGTCTRKIKKLVLDGTENWTKSNTFFYLSGITQSNGAACVSTHYPYSSEGINRSCMVFSNIIRIYDNSFSTDTDFKTYLQQQYANGTPVTIWYVLVTATTETITVPSGLSGTEEGYLNQNGTPTPTNPIYPTANTVEKWFDLNQYIMGTATDTLTSFPTEVIPDGTNASADILGNMSQSGTPSPSSPITPSETGDLTANLFDGTLYGGAWTPTFEINTDAIDPDIYKSLKIYLKAGVYTISFARHVNIVRRLFDGGYNQDTLADVSQLSFEISADGYIGISFRATATPAINWDNSPIMTNTGSTALPYEPYGQYKITILSANTTTPVYLGEVESTRSIKKLVLTGNEECYQYDFQNTKGVGIYNMLDSNYSRAYGLCSHYPVSRTQTLNSLWIGVNNKALYFVGIMDVLGISSASDFKTYLAQQYANVTPVCVWYVLAESTTGIVNEPIRKIGDYSDSVSVTNIPTTSGSQQFDVDTTLKPSEVALSYHGWHRKEPKERVNGDWE